MTEVKKKDILSRLVSIQRAANAKAASAGEDISTT